VTLDENRVTVDAVSGDNVELATDDPDPSADRPHDVEQNRRIENFEN
jgi:hypothetical protein